MTPLWVLCPLRESEASLSTESEAASHLWSRSQGLGFRYTTFIGDGDARTYNTITYLNGGSGPYSVPVIKEECINHVSKRLGTHLQKLKMDLRVAQETKTGNTRLVSQMMLTDKNIDLLAKAFVNNIHSMGPNATIEAEQNAILASSYHASSLDANPTHDLCPPGEKSWCWV